MQQSNDKESLKSARYQRNNAMKENPKSVQDINVKIKWKKILKVHEVLWQNPIKENS